MLLSLIPCWESSLHTSLWWIWKKSSQDCNHTMNVWCNWEQLFVFAIWNLLIWSFITKLLAVIVKGPQFSPLPYPHTAPQQKKSHKIHNSWYDVQYCMFQAGSFYWKWYLAREYNTFKRFCLQVRKTSQAALLVLLEQELIDQRDMIDQVCPVIIQLSSQESSDDYRTEAVAVSRLFFLVL